MIMMRRAISRRYLRESSRLARPWCWEAHAVLWRALCGLLLWHELRLGTYHHDLFHMTRSCQLSALVQYSKL